MKLINKEKQKARKKARSWKKELKKDAKEEKKKVKQQKKAALKKIKKKGGSKSQKKAVKQKAKKQIKQIKSEKKKGKKEIKSVKKKELKKASVKPSQGSAPKFVKMLWKRYVDLAYQFKLTKSKKIEPGAKLTNLVKKCFDNPMVAARIEAALIKKYRTIQTVSKHVLNHPRRLRFARMVGSLKSTLGKTWIYPAPFDENSVEMVFKKTGGGGKAGITLCKYEPDGRSQVLWTFMADPGKDNVGKTWRKAFKGVKGSMLAVVVDGKSVAKKIEYQVRLKKTHQGKLDKVKKETQSPVKGFADIHAHHMMHLAFSGGMLWPDPMSPLKKGKSCDGKNHGRIFLSKKEWQGKHTDRTTYPQDWPHHLDIMHQMMHADHLKQALDGGLKLLVVPVVNNMWMAHLVLKPDDTIPKNDMDNLRLQLKAAHAFSKKFPWYRIVRNPWEARKVIKAGKLAVVLAVEASHLMPKSHGNWKEQLDELYDLGVRSMQIVHETNSRFSGAAYHHGFHFRVMHFFKNAAPAKLTLLGKAIAAKDDSLTLATLNSIFPTGKENKMGVTKEGKELLKEMAKRGMVIEIDHCSRKARSEIFKYVMSSKTPKELRYYPLNFSHTRFDSLMPTLKQLEKEMGKKPKGAFGWDSKKTTEEYMATDAEAEKLIPTGGVFGIRTGPNAQKDCPGCPVENTCHTSSRSLAQIVYKGADMGLAMTLGTDIHGFASQVGARFEGHGPYEMAASGLPNQKVDDPKTDNPVGKPGKLSEFDTGGLKHIGLTPELLQDLENLGLNVDALKNSAESFLKMWERCFESNRKPLAASEYKKLLIQGPTVKRAVRKKKKAGRKAVFGIG